MSRSAMRPSRDGRGAAARKANLHIEALEGRLLLAHLAMWNSNYVGGQVSIGSPPSQVVPLAETNLDYTKPNFLAGQDLVSQLSSAVDQFSYTTKPAEKNFNFQAFAIAGDTNSVSAHIGTTKYGSVDELGSTIDLQVVPDSGETTNQAVDVTLHLSVNSSGGTQSYKVRYINEQDGPFDQILAAGSSSTSKDVTLHTMLGKTVSFSVEGHASASNSVGLSYSNVVIGLGVVLGIPNPPPPAITGPSVIKAAATGLSTIDVTFNAPLDPNTAQGVGAYQLLPTDGTTILISQAAYNSSTYTVTLTLSEPLSPGLTAQLVVHGKTIFDSADLTYSSDYSGQITAPGMPQPPPGMPQPPPGMPQPPPATAPHASGIVAVGHSKNGVTSITVAFDQSMNVSAVGNKNQYSVLGGQKKRKATVYNKVMKIGSISYDAVAYTATIKLAKPYKGTVRVTVLPGILSAGGVPSIADFTAIAM